MKHKASHIYINPQGVPCAPTKEIHLVKDDGRLTFSFQMAEQLLGEAKASCIPIREEDKYRIMDQLWRKCKRINNPVSLGYYVDALGHFEDVDKFYPVEPYEFEEDYTDGWIPSYNDPDNAGCHPPAEPTGLVRIIRPG